MTRWRETQARFWALDILFCVFLYGVTGVVLGCGMVCDDVHKIKREREGSEWSERQMDGGVYMW